MELHFWQILLISIWGGIGGIDLRCVQLHIHRPLVSGLVVGLILGDVQAGLVAGGTFELLFMGYINIGGAAPPNVVVGGIVGVVYAIVTRTSAGVALSIALPFALITQAFLTLLYTLFTFVMPIGDRACDTRSFATINLINYFGLALLFVLSFTMVFIPTFFSNAVAHAIITYVPQSVLEGFALAGKLLPAVGFGILLKVMLSQKQYFIFLLIGFVAASFLKLPVIAIATIGVTVAIYDYLVNDKIDQNKGGPNAALATDGGGEEDGI